MSDEGLASLAGLTVLSSLELQGTRVSDAGLAHLAGLPALRRVNLVGTRVSPKEAARLAGFRPEMDVTVPYERPKARGPSNERKP